MSTETRTLPWTFGCSHGCGICDSDRLSFDGWDGPDAWWTCQDCEAGHTSRDCCSPVRVLDTATPR